MTLILTRVTHFITKILTSSSQFKQELQFYGIIFTISEFRLNLIQHINKMKYVLLEKPTDISSDMVFVS